MLDFHCISKVELGIVRLLRLIIKLLVVTIEPIKSTEANRNPITVTKRLKKVFTKEIYVNNRTCVY